MALHSDVFVAEAQSRIRIREVLCMKEQKQNVHVIYGTLKLLQMRFQETGVVVYEGPGRLLSVVPLS